MEWDNDGATPSPLQPVECWPRLRGRRNRFSPRQVECRGEAQPPSPANEPDGGEDRATHRRTGATTSIKAPSEAPPGEPAPVRKRRTALSPGIGGRLCSIDWGGRKSRRYDDLPTVSLTSATAPNGVCSSGVSGRYPETGWMPLLAHILIVARRAFRGSHVANLQMCSAVTAAGEGPPFSRIRGVVRPTGSICGSKGRQGMENRCCRAHSDVTSRVYQLV